MLHENTCDTTTEDDDGDDVHSGRPASCILQASPPMYASQFGTSCAAVAGDNNAPFIYQNQRLDLEQAIFVQDLIHLNKRTISAGLRCAYDAGLPFEFDGDKGEALSQYGQQIIDRINFDCGRILPSFQVNASAGADLYNNDRIKLRIQSDGKNLTSVLDVIDIGGLFSGNAIGPSRSFSLRLSTIF